MTIVIMTIMLSGTVNAQVMGNWRYNGQRIEVAQLPQIAQALVNNPSEFNFQAKALMNANTLSYVATFNVSQVGNDLKDVVTKSDDRIRNFIDDLIREGVDTNNITVDMISLIPVYDYEVEKKLFSKTYNEIPVGFELQKNILIKYDKSSKLDIIVKSAVLNEIYDLVKVDYYVDNIEGIKDTLRKKTILYLEKKLKDLSALGVDFDSLYTVFSEDYQTIMPHSKYENYIAFSRPSIDAAQGKSFFGVESKVRRSGKLKTMFYNPVSFKDFDIVINPVILEPVVQFTYSINIKFIIKEKRVVPKTKYMLLTPDGKIQQLQL